MTAADDWDGYDPQYAVVGKLSSRTRPRGLLVSVTLRASGQLNHAGARARQSCFFSSAVQRNEQAVDGRVDVIRGTAVD